MKKEITTYLSPSGSLISGFGFLASILLGFGGFNFPDFFNYSISGFTSKSQMFFLVLTIIGFLILSISWYKQSQKSKIHKLILFLYLLVIIVFSITSIIGLTSQMRNSDFWAQTNFVEPHIILLFNNFTLYCFLSLGIVQIILSILFFKNKLNNPNRLSRTGKRLILISGILLLMKTIIDYPLLREAMFILSFNYRIPILNNVVSLISPICFLIAQIELAKILIRK